ncbi:MAG: hypothetical protein QG597_2089 [Actinomycetota bacterium]|nr:hypothetical protein [Actinomycetota bacterium]
MIPAHAAVQARQLHADGWTVSAIARRLGHDRKTVRIYLAGVRDPGQPRAGTSDLFGSIDGYATRRLSEDPHLSAAALHRELAALDYTGSYSALTRSLRQRGLLTDCPDCRREALPQITTRASELNHLHPRQPLPIRVAPVFGQTIASFLDQVAAANHLPPAVLLAHLPTWFRHQHRTHDDLARSDRAHPDDADVLAELTGNDANALRRALPALAGWSRDPSRPVRLTTACRRCTARRAHHAVVPVHLPALQRLCLRHRTWLGHVRQIDTSNCPDIVLAAQRAACLARHHSPTRVLLAETTARETIKRWLAHDRHPVLTRRWTTRLDRLDASQPPTDADPCDREDLIAAATYSDTITIATALLSSTITETEARPRAEATAHLLGSLQLARQTTN